MAAHASPVHWEPKTGGQVLACSLFGAVFLECSWLMTGGGYSCSLPLFLALFCYCYGRELASPSILRTLRKNVKTNIGLLCREEKCSIFLIALFVVTTLSLAILEPSREGYPLSLIAFTVLFMCIFILPVPFQLIWRRKTLSSSRTRLLWSERVCPYWQALVTWRRGFLLCVVLVVSSYVLDGSITALVRFLVAKFPCWPLLPPLQGDKADVPLNLLAAHLWHETYPRYKPLWVFQKLALLGRNVGDVVHLLPMLIGTYVLCQIFLPPRNSLIKKALFASIAGVVLGGVTSGTLKILFHRYGPNAYGNPYMWTGPGMTTVNHFKFTELDQSFPAGHTTVTSAVATCWYMFILFHFKNLCLSPCINLFLLLCLYVNPVLVLLSRVSECCHWTSDATFGIFLGYVIGIAITSRLKQSPCDQEHASAESSLSLVQPYQYHI